MAVCARPRGAMVRVLVADSGTGIAPSERLRIFEAFYQIDNPARDRTLGLGLGLAIVRDLAALLGLRVRLQSRVGRGSVFAVEIPASRLAPMAAPMTDEPLQDLVPGALVLLVDDDAMARDAMAVTLRDFGCRVIAADSSADALRQLEATGFPPQFIVTDYRLKEGRTGLQAILEIDDYVTRTYGAEFVPVALVISGDTSPAELRQVSDAGFAMLHKPVSSGVLHLAMNAGLHARMRGSGAAA